MKNIRAILSLTIATFCIAIAESGRTRPKEHKSTPLPKLTRHYDIHVNNAICLKDPLFLKNVTCRFKPTNTTSHRWSFDGFLNDGFQLDTLFGKFSVFRKMNNMEYRPFMIINITVDICSVMRGMSNPLINVFAKQLRSFSNLYQPCPVRGHIYIKEHDMDISDFPPIVPIGFYHTHFIYYTQYKGNDRIVLQTICHFEVIPKGTERF